MVREKTASEMSEHELLRELKRMLRERKLSPDALAGFYERTFGMDLTLLPAGKMCDFCLAPGPIPSKTYLAQNDYRLTLEDGEEYVDETGLWGACLECSALIDQALRDHNWHPLVGRCLEGNLRSQVDSEGRSLAEQSEEVDRAFRIKMGLMIAAVFDEKIIAV